MNPDGLSYLDLASASVTGGPSKLVNGYWSPGYPALIGIAMFLVRPSSGQEFPLVHFVNLLIFIFALWAFSTFLHYWLESLRGDELPDENWKTCVTCVKPFAFCAFLWYTLKFIGTEVVTPDLGMAAIVFLAAGFGCRLSLPDARWWHYGSLGFILGVGYYVKAAMFPLALVFLVLLSFLLPLSRGVTRQKLLVSLSFSCLAFLLVAAPLVAALSVRAKTLSFGEAGRLNYAWYANQRRWADDVEHPKVNETADHPAPKLLKTPLTLAFASPINGTYPLWYDPSYWYADLKVRFDLHKQITAIKETVPVYKNLVYESMAFISGAIVLWVFAFHEKLHLIALRRLFWQIAWPLVAFSMFALVHVEPRFLGAFLVLFWLAIYGALIFRTDRRITAAICATVLSTVMIPFTGHVTKEGVRIARDLVHPRQPEYQIAALGLRDLGLQRGDRLAIVGFAYNCFYARYDGLRIVAQIPNANEFWHLNTPELKSLEERLSSIGVKAVVASKRPDTYALNGDWRVVKVSDAVQLSVLLLSPEVVRKTR